MTDQPTPQAPLTSRVVEHGEASELPESGWLWRRVFTYALAVGLLALTWHIVGLVNDVATLRMVAHYALLLIGLLMLLYIAGASATDIVKLISAVRTTRRETITTGPAQ